MIHRNDFIQKYIKQYDINKTYIVHINWLIDNKI